MKINICDHEDSQIVKDIRKQMDDKLEELKLSFSEPENNKMMSEENPCCDYRTPAKTFEQEKQPSKLYAFYRRNRMWFLLGLLIVSSLTTLGIIFPIQTLKWLIGIVILGSGLGLYGCGTIFLGSKIDVPLYPDNNPLYFMNGILIQLATSIIFLFIGIILCGIYDFGSWFVNSILHIVG
jgi:hypothetical protein